MLAPIVVLSSFFLCIAKPPKPTDGSGPPPKPTDGSGPPSGSSKTQNVHVTFGEVAACTAPPSGNCADYTITEATVTASLDGFTTYNSGTLKTTSFNDYGGWWETNVGTSASVASDFCTSGSGATQTATPTTYSGVTYTSSSGSWTLGSSSTPPHDCENYCSAAGGSTPPLMGSTFTKTYTQSFSLTPSSKSRADISNTVGYAVNGVVIFSPFTGKSSVAPYDETLDTCIGHPANGLYHYHGFSPCVHGESGTQTGNSIAHSKIYGWAFDGFPIYGPYGYTDGSDVSSTVTRVTGGYACTTNGAACSTDAEKAVSSNWVYSPSNGMLDDCNGRWTKTPEFPDGMYVYVLNIQSNGNPDFPGVPYCLQSTASSSPASAPANAGAPAPSPANAGAPAAAPAEAPAPAPSPANAGAPAVAPAEAPAPASSPANAGAPAPSPANAGAPAAAPAEAPAPAPSPANAGAPGAAPAEAPAPASSPANASAPAAAPASSLGNASAPAAAPAEPRPASSAPNRVPIGALIAIVSLRQR